MKTEYPQILALTAFAFLAAGSVICAEDQAGEASVVTPNLNFASSRTIEMTPDDKRPLSVKDVERNPYAKRAPEEEEIDGDDEDSQANRIRNRLLSMPVGGCSVGDKGRRILVGSVVLEKGRRVEKLLPDQTENLKVLKITEKEIKFGWLDTETGELSGKTMVIAYDLSPGVRYLLPGGLEEDENGEPLMGIIQVDEERKKSALEYEKLNPKNKLPAGVYERAQ